MTSPLQQWSGEGTNSVTAARQAYEQRLRKMAEAHCATTESNVITAANVGHAARVLDNPPGGPFWLALDVMGTLFMGLGVNLATGANPQCLVTAALVLGGGLLVLSAKLTAHLPQWEWWNKKVRIRRWWL